MENYILFSEIGSGFGEPGGTPPPKIPRTTPEGVLFEERRDCLTVRMQSSRSAGVCKCSVSLLQFHMDL